MKCLVLSGDGRLDQESTPTLGDFLRKTGHEVTITAVKSEQTTPQTRGRTGC